MGKARNAVLGGLLGAAAAVVLAPRLGESRREALDHLRLAVRPGRGALRAFAGTPCAQGDRVPDGSRGGASPGGDASGAPSRGGGDDPG